MRRSSVRGSRRQFLLRDDLGDHPGGVGLVIEGIVDEPDFSPHKLRQPFLNDRAGDGRLARQVRSAIWPIGSPER